MMPFTLCGADTGDSAASRPSSFSRLGSTVKRKTAFLSAPTGRRHEEQDANERDSPTTSSPSPLLASSACSSSSRSFSSLSSLSLSSSSLSSSSFSSSSGSSSPTGSSLSSRPTSLSTTQKKPPNPKSQSSLPAPSSIAPSKVQSSKASTSRPAKASTARPAKASTARPRTKPPAVSLSGIVPAPTRPAQIPRSPVGTQLASGSGGTRLANGHRDCLNGGMTPSGGSNLFGEATPSGGSTPADGAPMPPPPPSATLKPMVLSYANYKKVTKKKQAARSKADPLTQRSLVVATGAGQKGGGCGGSVKTLRLGASRGDVRAGTILVPDLPISSYVLDVKLFAVPDERLGTKSVVAALPRLRPPVSKVSGHARLQFMIREVEIHKNTVWLLGSTAEGCSVALQTAFEPWFFVQCPSHWKTTHLEEFQEVLNTNQAYCPRYERNAVRSIVFEQRQELIGFNFEQKTQVARVTLRSLKSYRHFLNALKSPIAVDGEALTFKVFNDDIPLRVQVLTSIDTTMYGWVSVGGINLTGPEDVKKPVTMAQIEYTCASSHLRSHMDMQGIAPLLRVSFDIETVRAQPDGHFPRAADRGDMIITISNWFYWSTKKEPVLLLLLCMGDVADIDLKARGLPECTRVLCFRSEVSLLQAWRQILFLDNDVDEIVGYHSIGYDLPYILERAEVLCLPEMRDIGKFRGVYVESKERKPSSAQRGDDRFVYTDIPGRTQFDLLRVVRKDKKLASYKLKDVALTLLKDKQLEKIDLPYEAIRPYFVEGPGQRAEIAVYCARDSQITYRIGEKQMYFNNHYQMSKLTSTTNSQLMIAGEAVKIWTVICDRIERNGWILHKGDLEALNEKYPIEYEGGKVLDPVTGFYNEPIACFDFASLYPSIMISILACYSTLVLDPVKIARARATGWDVLEVDIGCKYNPHFVQGRHLPDGRGYVPAKSLLPATLVKLIAARGVAKELEEKAKDPDESNIYKATQLAIKVTNNATYGFTSAGNTCNTRSGHKRLSSSSMPTGGPVKAKTGPSSPAKKSGGFLSCVAIASAVTARAREMLLATVAYMEKEGGKVVYGDTDSVMVKFPNPGGVRFPVNATTAEALAPVDAYLKEMQAHSTAVTKIMRPPNKLQMEKVFVRLHLQGKKKYSYHSYQYKDGSVVASGLQMKGLEPVRRDWCGVARRVGKSFLEKILAERSVDELLAYFGTVVQAMRDNQIPLEEYALSRQLKAEYRSAKVIHWQVAKKMAARHPDRPPVPGERIQYMVCDVPGACHMRGEEFDWAVGHGLRPDRAYYFLKQVLPPAARILGTVNSNALKDLTAIGNDLLRDCSKNQDIRLFGSLATQPPTATLIPPAQPPSLSSVSSSSSCAPPP